MRNVFRFTAFVISAVLVAAIAGPLAGAALGVLRGRGALGGGAFQGSIVALAAAVLSGAVLALGADVEVALAGRALLSLDGLGAITAVVVALVGTTVLGFASRNLDGAASERFAWAAACVLAGTQAMVLAARPSVLVVGWVATTLSVLALLGERGTASARAGARARRALLAGDACLLVAAGLTVQHVGDPTFAELSSAVRDLTAPAVALPLDLTLRPSLVVALLLVAAAIARAGQVLAPSWLVSTVEAPTPVSALLHAGVVNAGAILLLRFAPVLEVEPAALWVLALSSVATIVVVAVTATLRRDRKGELALSTSAQMAFMLLAIAVGAPAAAVAHLAGHALYKSERFLGAGGTVAALRTARARRGPGAEARQRERGVVLAAVVAATVVGSALVVSPHALHGPGGWLLASTAAVGVFVGVRTWAQCSPLGVVGTAATAVGGSAAAVVALLVGATAIETAIGAGDAVAESTPSAPLLLVVLCSALLAAHLVARSPSHGARVRLAFASFAQPPARPRPGVRTTTERAGSSMAIEAAT